MGRHPCLIHQAGVWIFEISVGDQIAAAGECIPALVVHAEQGRLMAALLEAIHEIEKVSFCSAKPVVVLVAIKDSHIEVWV